MLRRPNGDRRGGPGRRAGSRLRRTRRARLRRGLASGLAGAGVLIGLSVLRPAPRAVGEPTVVAAHALAAGVVVGPGDVRIEPRPAEHRPESAPGSLGTVVGHTTAVAISARDVVTPERLVGPGLLAGQAPGRVAMTVPVVGVGLAGVRAGSRVDVFATGTGERVASDVLVLAVSGAGATGGGADPSGGAPGTGTGSVGGGMPFSDQQTPAVTLALAPEGAAAIARQLSALAGGESFVLAVHGST